MPGKRGRPVTLAHKLDMSYKHGQFVVCMVPGSYYGAVGMIDMEPGFVRENRPLPPDVNINDWVFMVKFGPDGPVHDFTPMEVRHADSTDIKRCGLEGVGREPGPYDAA